MAESAGNERYAVEAAVAAEQALKAVESRNDEIDRLKEDMLHLNEQLVKLRRFAPPVAEKRARRIRNGGTLGGLLAVGAGAWWVYPPSALLLIGGLVLAASVTGIVISSKRVR